MHIDSLLSIMWHFCWTECDAPNVNLICDDRISHMNWIGSSNHCNSVAKGSEANYNWTCHKGIDILNYQNEVNAF